MNTMLRTITVSTALLALVGCASLERQAQKQTATVGVDRVLVDLDGNEVFLPTSLSSPFYAGEEVGDAAVMTSLKREPWLRPTPAEHPSASVMYTSEALEALRGGDAIFVYVGDTIDPDGRVPVIPGSLWWPSAGVIDTQETGNDTSLDGAPLTARIVEELDAVTAANPEQQVIFYCDRKDCWMPYNAALRLSDSSYQNIAWYRGGTEAWNAAGLPLDVLDGPSWF